MQMQLMDNNEVRSNAERRPKQSTRTVAHSCRGLYRPPIRSPPQNQYMQQRSTAIESIESTISELGSIFSQLAHMVAEQRETVQRIDDNILEVADNVSGAQRELLKYYNSVASNRWLMLKIFGVSANLELD